MHSATGKSSALHVLIVGAGFGGLSRAIACRREGFRVTVFDQARELLPIGNSIGFAPNTTRLFKRWGPGFFEKLQSVSSTSKSIIVHDFKDGRVLAVDDMPGKSKEKFGEANLIGHRGRYHMLFLDHAEALGVVVKRESKVIGYDVDTPSTTLQSGEVVVGDVVVAANGVQSLGRTQVLDHVDTPVHSGYAVWRAFMDGAIFMGDPLTKGFLENGKLSPYLLSAAFKLTVFILGDSIHLHLGPDMHGFVVGLGDGKNINAVLTHKDEANIDEGWSFPGKKSDILPLIKDWDPGFRRVWELMDESNIFDWKWVTDSGKVAILGDAAHPFLPTSVQGASQAIEDGVTLAKCLAKSNGNVPLAMHTYFELRYEHVVKAQAMGVAQRNKWHNLHDKETGELKADFDISGGLLESYSLASHDCEKIVEENWTETSTLVMEKMMNGGKLHKE